MGLGGGNTAAQTTQSMSPGGKMNLIINLHQNVTSPPQMQQQSVSQKTKLQVKFQYKKYLPIFLGRICRSSTQIVLQSRHFIVIAFNV